MSTERRSRISIADLPADFEVCPESLRLVSGGTMFAIGGRYGPLSDNGDSPFDLGAAGHLAGKYGPLSDNGDSPWGTVPPGWT